MAMSKILRYMAVAIVALVVAGCIRNDVPYPIVKLNILSFEATGMKAPATINPTACTVDFELEEIIDPRNVSITEVTFTEGAQSDVAFPGKFDLRKTLYVNLSMYQTFEWSIRANQSIERYFRVEGQIGESEIDPVGCVATAYVPMDYDMNDVKITAAKFGPKDITSYNPDPMSFTSFDDTVHHVMVTYHNDIEEMWTLKIVQKDIDVEFTAIDAWAKRIWLYANGRSGEKQGFRYRAMGTEEWIEVENVKVEGGSFSACIEGLEPLTDYEVVAYVDESVTANTKVTTEATFVLPNAGFEEWSFANKCYFPYAEGAEPFWGTGNPGSTTLGDAFNLTTPNTTDLRPGTEGTTSANLQSMYPNMAGIGKFAAGNLFMGRFAGTIGTNGIVHFGRPCEARPVALHGWYKYNCGTIDKVGKVPSSRPDIGVGSRDEGQIMIAVGDWSAEKYGGDADSPIAIDTRDESTFFNLRGENVIGGAEIILKESTDGWVEFTLPLEYTTTSKVPTHLLVVFTGSRFGDYFTGSTESLLIVDDIELVY